ncbi:MAG: hypothetical protein RL701_4972 [Pseudomonadota bacterium]|jgi:hypothetical protein
MTHNTVVTSWSSAGALLLTAIQPVSADERSETYPPETFQYAVALNKNYVRMVLELTGVFSVGLVWYITNTEIGQDYNFKYNWKTFRQKLTGDALGLDTNHLGTNFIGHPLGGSAYYWVARGNRLGIAESAGIAVGGSLLWEYFGEVSEIVSLNDMIVTPLAGIAIGEAFTQLGAFFDRSSPAWHNRVLSILLTPFKNLNDALDGASLGRSQLDQRGFPADEWHQFDLNTGAAWLSQHAQNGAANFGAVRFSMNSQLARLPAYTRPGRAALWFSDAQVSRITIDGAFDTRALVDFNLATQVVMVGYYTGAKTHSTRIGWSMGFQYTIHDFDRDRTKPVDRIASIEPLGLSFEQRAQLGATRFSALLDAGGDFGGVVPYALADYAGDSSGLPDVTRAHGYYFGLGGRVTATLIGQLESCELRLLVRFEGYRSLESDPRMYDQRSFMSARASCGVPSTVLRLAFFLERRARAGDLQDAHAQRSELTSGLELGVRL